MMFMKVIEWHIKWAQKRATLFSTVILVFFGFIYFVLFEAGMNTLQLFIIYLLNVLIKSAVTHHTSQKFTS